MLCGDFLQLPPAEETLAPEMLAVLEPAGVADRTAVSGNRGSCSQAASWRACATGVHRLTTAHRQGDKTALLRGTEPAPPSGKSAVAKASVTATVLNLIINVVGAPIYNRKLRLIAHSTPTQSPYLGPVQSTLMRKLIYLEVTN